MPKKIFIGGLSWNMTENELHKEFGRFGEIVSIRIPTHHQTGQRKGFAFIEYAEAKSGHMAIDEMDGTSLYNRKIKVDAAQEKAFN